MGVVLETRSGPMSLVQTAFEATANSGSIADPADTTTNPVVSGLAGTGVLRLGDGGAFGPNSLKIIPIGTASSTNTFLMSVFAIERILRDDQATPAVWTYHLLAAFTCTLCTKAVSTKIVASGLYCGTIALNTGNAGVSVEVVSPTGNQAGHVIVDTKGAELVQVKFDRNSSATSCNAFWARL